jgi:hypothetical protein
VVVVELVEIESGLLSSHQVDMEFQSARAHLEWRALGALQESGPRLHAFGVSHGAVVALDDALGGEKFLEHIGNHGDAEVHGKGRGLNDEMGAILIHDESRDSVTFAPGDPPGLAGAISIGFPVGESARQPPPEEIGVQVLLAA